MRHGIVELHADYDVSCYGTHQLKKKRIKFIRGTQFQHFLAQDMQESSDLGPPKTF